MDTGVCAPCPDDAGGRTDDRLDRPLELALDGRQAALDLEASEVGSVVLQEERDGAAGRGYSTSSMIAMSALSPMRLPILTMRVYPPGRSAKRGPITWIALSTTSSP